LGVVAASVFVNVIVVVVNVTLPAKLKLDGTKIGDADKVAQHPAANNATDRKLTNLLPRITVFLLLNADSNSLVFEVSTTNIVIVLEKDGVV
jgi:hypothetical protein